MDPKRQQFWDSLSTQEAVTDLGWECADVAAPRWYDWWTNRGRPAQRRAFAEACFKRFKASLLHLENGEGFEGAKQVREIWKNNQLTKLENELKAGMHADKPYGSITVTILLFIAGQVIKYLINKWLDS